MTFERNEVGLSTTEDYLGNIYVTGNSQVAIYNSKLITIKYDSNGNQIWVKEFSGSMGCNAARSIIVDDQLNIYVLAISLTSNSNGFDYALIKYDSNGNENWVSYYNGPASLDDNPTGMGLDSQGNIYVCGGSDNSNSGSD